MTSGGRVGPTSLVLATLVLLPGVSVAQPDPPPLVTDCPSFTSAARVVGPGTVQMESGVSITRDRLEIDGSVRLNSPPSSYPTRCCASG